MFHQTMFRLRSIGLAVLLACQILLLGGSGPATAKVFVFDHLSAVDGLSQGSGNAVLQDRRGFLWVGTQEGLNRFDGYRVEVFRSDLQDPHSLADNFIIHLFEDRDGKIWVLHQKTGALSRFDPLHESFERWLHRPDDEHSLLPAQVNAAAIFEDSASLWIGTFGSGINRIDKKTGAVQRIVARPDDLEGLPGNGVFRMATDARGRLLVGTNKGLARARDNEGGATTSSESVAFERISRSADDPVQAGEEPVTGLHLDRSGRLWVGTLGGFFLLDEVRNELVRWRPKVSDPLWDEAVIAPIRRPIAETPDGKLWLATNQGVCRLDLEASRVGCNAGDVERLPVLATTNLGDLLVDSSGQLWIGTQGAGLFLIDPATGSITSFSYRPDNPRGLPSNFVLTLYEGKAGIVWIGTNNGGVSRVSPYKQRFEHLEANPDQPEQLADNKVFAVAEGTGETLWIGTMEGGLHHLDTKTMRVTERYFLEPGSPKDLTHNFVRAVFQQDSGKVWAGTIGNGLVEIDPEAGRVLDILRHDPSKASSLGHDVVSSIYEDTRGELWVGTNNGWCRFDPEAKTFEVFRSDPEDSTSLVNSVARFTTEDRSGRLWVGTTGGLSRFDRERRSFVSYRHDPADPSSLSNPNVMDLYEDTEGTYWVATYGGGLNRFDPEAETFEILTRKDGLPSDAIYSVLPDEGGFLWLSTNQGLSRFDPATRSFRNFGAADGLGGIEFNGRSFLRASNGWMYFGGMHGLNRFRPEDIVPNPHPPPVTLTEFRKFDQVQKLDLATPEIQEIVLTHRDDYFSFEFAALDFTDPSQNQYAYILEGFDKGWIHSGTRRYASYTNLDGGRYTFKVKASNSDGVWSEQPTEVAVVVIPPPWKTWWAYLLYLTVAGGGVFAYVRFKTLAQKEELARQKVELDHQRALAERLRQIDRMKDEFLANTSHELRTPLNGIIGIAESLIDGATGDLGTPTRSNLAMVAASGRRLAHLVDDILDFSKLRNHELEIRHQPVALRELVDIVLTLSRPLLANRTLTLHNRVPASLPLAEGDENRLQQVLHNLVGNAVKFTAEGEVSILGQQVGDFLEIQVTDSGIGIAADKLEKIFDSFVQADASTAREYGGTGLGLAISRQLVELHGGELRARSELGRGSTFWFTLPVWKGETPDGKPSSMSLQLDRVQSLALRESTTAEPGALPQVGTTSVISGNADTADTADTPSPVVGSKSSRGTVLIVDDEPINLQVLHNLLGLADYSVLDARDGAGALKILAEEPNIELLLLDVMMPGMTGFEVTRRIRRHRMGYDLPIILVTAKNQVSDLEEGLAAGANDYLTKPFSKNELLARIRTHLSLSRAHSAEAENRRKSEELEQARRIQLSLLPQSPPPTPFLDIAAMMKTATEVGGDYYDFFPQPDGSLYVVTGDATGHGISAGMIVSMTKSALRALEVQSPHILLGQLNGVIRAVHLERMKMALNALHISPHEGVLSSAGMPPMFRYDKASGEVEEIMIPGLPLGGLDDSDYRLHPFDLHLGDVLVLISDGLPELLSAEGEELGYQAVGECLQQNGNGSAKEILQALIARGESWNPSSTCEDDITVVVLKRV